MKFSRLAWGLFLILAGIVFIPMWILVAILDEASTLLIWATPCAKVQPVEVLSEDKP